MAIFGAKEVLYADVLENYAVPLDADFEELCKTYRDTIEIVDADDDITDEYSDQSDEPIVSLSTPGKTEGKFSAYDYDTATLIKLLGGTAVDGEWTEGDRKPKTIALRFLTDSGHRITYPAVSFRAKKNIKLLKKNIALIDCTFTVLAKPKIKKLA